MLFLPFNCALLVEFEVKFININTYTTEKVPILLVLRFTQIMVISKKQILFNYIEIRLQKIIIGNILLDKENKCNEITA